MSAAGSTVAAALEHYESQLREEEEEQNALPFWMREDDNAADDSDDEQPRSSLFCGGLNALCTALNHLHPLEAASPRRQQRPQEATKRHIPASEDPVTGAGEAEDEEEEAHTDAEEEEVEVDMMMRVSSPLRRTTPSPRPMQPRPLSFLQQQGHNDVHETYSTRSPTTTPLDEMLTTLRNRPHPSPPSPPISTRERLTAAIVGPPKVPQKFVQCMSCREEEWLQVPRSAKYVRCPTCSSITIALASNTRFPEGEGGAGERGEATARMLLSPCTRIMSLFSSGGRRGL